MREVALSPEEVKCRCPYCGKVVLILKKVGGRYVVEHMEDCEHGMLYKALEGTLQLALFGKILAVERPSRCVLCGLEGSM